MDANLAMLKRSNTLVKSFFNHANRILLVTAGLVLFSVGSFAQDKGQPAFKIGSKVTTVGEVATLDQAAFYEVEKKKFDLIDRIARDKYLEFFWELLFDHFCQRNTFDKKHHALVLFRVIS